MTSDDHVTQMGIAILFALMFGFLAWRQGGRK